MSDDEIRRSDITDLKEADRILHSRIRRTQEANTEMSQNLWKKMDEIQKDIRELEKPIGVMSNQVSTNEKGIVRVEKDYKKSVEDMSAIIEKWDRRAWMIVVALLIEFVAIVYRYLAG